VQRQVGERASEGKLRNSRCFLAATPHTRSGFGELILASKLESRARFSERANSCEASSQRKFEHAVQISRSSLSPPSSTSPSLKMATAPLNIDTKRLPTTPQWSPILSHSSLSSPRSSSTSTPDDLSSRCRKLARSFGEHSILDDPHFEPQSPSRSRENSQENSSSSPLPPPPPASPLGRHSHHLPLSPPTPEGSHVLNEILEEENESMTGTPIRDEEEEEKGLGFEKGAGEAMQFKMSPCLGGQMSLHGAGIALEEQARGGGGGAGLGLSLHDQMKMDNEEIGKFAVSLVLDLIKVQASPVLTGGDYVDHDRALQEELKNGKDWIKLDVSLVDDELLASLHSFPIQNVAKSLTLVLYR